LSCVCCGLKISGDKFHTAQGYVCERCWNDPNFFFPEKIMKNERVKKLFDSYNDSKFELLKMNVIKLNQKNVDLYTGKLKIKEVLNLYAVCNFEEETLEGYQRELYDDQVNDLYQYMKECPIAIMPSILISIRDGINFTRYSIDDENITDFGKLEIPIKKGAFWIIDGQHRIGSFEKFLANIVQFKTDDENYNAYLDTFLNYEVPITFIDSSQAINLVKKDQDISLSPTDVERAIFFIINKTHKRLSPSLEDALQYCIKTSGVPGIPSIEKNKWRSEATAIALQLNFDENSSLYQKINISGTRGLNRPLQLNSFVSSLKPIFNIKQFSEHSLEDKKTLLFIYWNSIKNINKEAFNELEYKKYLLLKSIGVYSLNLLLCEYLNLQTNSDVLLKKENIEIFVYNLKYFDWRKQDSIIANFGGMKGVKETHRLLLDHLYKNKK
jgi:DGQHR domain-containing protein